MLKLQDTGKQRDFPCAMHKRGTLLHPTYDIPIDLLVSSRPQLIFHICFLNKFRKLSKSGDFFFFFLVSFLMSNFVSFGCTRAAQNVYFCLENFPACYQPLCLHAFYGEILTRSILDIACVA